MKKITIWHTIRFMAPLAFRAAPLRFCIVNVLGVSQAVVLAGNTILFSHFVDALADSAGKGVFGSYLLWRILFYVAGVIGYQLFNSLFNYVLNEYLEICSELFRYKYNSVISGVAPVRFEDVESLDEMQKAAAGRDVANIFVFHLIGIVDMVPPYVILICAYITSLNPWLALCVIASFIPAIFTLYMQRCIYTKHEDTAAPIRRRYHGYKDCIVNRQYLKETRILGGYGYFFDRVSREWELLRREEAKVSGKTNLLDAANNAMGLAGYLGALVLLVGSVLTGVISVGAFAAVYHSLNKLFDMVFSLVCGFIGSTVSNLPAVENYVGFLERGSDVREAGGLSGTEEAISLSDVSFTYPGAQDPSVNGVSIRILKGEHVALVGENGAGKSTLAKLILGIYTPDDGCVNKGDHGSIAGRTEAGRGRMTAVFQDFSRYQMTLYDNVKISDIAGEDIPDKVLGDTSLDRKLVENCENTMLSREFGGIELSGGMWQQVAIARGRYRGHEIIVMDEPTAAIDPIEESNVYHNFLSMAEGKTAIVVSHRLGSARLADRILVMSGGRIVGDGTHEALMEQCGVYREMWEAQAGNYLKN